LHLNITALMAPKPPQPTDNLFADPDVSAKPYAGYWTKANIAFTAVFAILSLIFLIVLLTFYLRRRSHKKKRVVHPKSDQAGLLEHEDKTNMFSRGRHSSVTLYVDSEADAQNKRASQDTISLVPLQVTPLEEVHDPMNRTNTTTTASNGSGVSALSAVSRLSSNTMMLSPISPNAEDGDMGIRPSGRPRSTSTTSQKARYYETAPTNIEMPPIPKIIHTPSD
jgi:hypothetical protein